MMDKNNNDMRYEKNKEEKCANEGKDDQEGSGDNYYDNFNSDNENFMTK